MKVKVRGGGGGRKGQGKGLAQEVVRGEYVSGCGLA